jgi:hypothetical protein
VSRCIRQCSRWLEVSSARPQASACASREEEPGLPPAEVDRDSFSWSSCLLEIPPCPAVRRFKAAGSGRRASCPVRRRSVQGRHTLAPWISYRGVWLKSPSAAAAQSNRGARGLWHHGDCGLRITPLPALHSFVSRLDARPCWPSYSPGVRTTDGSFNSSGTCRHRRLPFA